MAEVAAVWVDCHKPGTELIHICIHVQIKYDFFKIMVLFIMSIPAGFQMITTSSICFDSYSKLSALLPYGSSPAVSFCAYPREWGLRLVKCHCSHRCDGDVEWRAMLICQVTLCTHIQGQDKTLHMLMWWVVSYILWYIYFIMLQETENVVALFVNRCKKIT